MMIQEKISPHLNELPCKEEKKNGKESAIGICDVFIQETGMHGINKLQKSRTLLRRVIWGCIILGCLVYLIIIVTRELQKFFTYPTTTSLDVDIAKELDFPAVTICNLSPYNRSKVKPDYKLRNYDLSVSGLALYAKTINWSDPYYEQNGYFEPIPRDFLNNSMELSKMIPECSFDNIWYDAKDIFQQTLTTAGPCYTFNKHGNVSTSMKGGSYNLNVGAFIDQMNYYYGFTVGSGVKVILHDPREKPDINNEGLTVPPGNIAYISISKMKYEYLSYPYKAFKDGYCLDLEAKSYRNPLKRSNYYSINACMDECYNELAEKRMNCTLIYAFEGSGRPCSRYEAKKYGLEFLSLFLDTNIGLRCNRQCPLPCKYTKFASQISYGQYPSDFISEELQRLLGHSNNISTEFFRNNYLNVRVFYEQLLTTTVRQVPVYSSLEQILANLGGQMGLFLGASIITLTELVEFIIHLVLYLLKKWFTVLLRGK